MCVCVCVCVRERESLCPHVCVSELERESVCVPMCLWKREREKGHTYEHLSLLSERERVLISILVCLSFVKQSMSSKRLMTLLCINTMKSCIMTSQCYKIVQDQVFFATTRDTFMRREEKKWPKPILNYNSWFLLDHAIIKSNCIKWFNAFLFAFFSVIV